MEIKNLTKQHIEQIHQISIQQFENESWTQKQIQDSIESQTSICIGTFVDDELVSYAISQDSLDDINLLLIATKNNQKNKGFAKLLMKYLDDVASAQQKTFSLEVKNTNTVAISLYEKFGFKTLHIRKKYYKDGADAFIMFKQKK